MNAYYPAPRGKWPLVGLAIVVLWPTFMLNLAEVVDLLWRHGLWPW